MENVWRWRTDNALMANKSYIYDSSVPWNSAEPNSGTTYNWLVWYPDSNRLYDYPWATLVRYICQHRGTVSLTVTVYLYLCYRPDSTLYCLHYIASAYILVYNLQVHVHLLV